MKNKNNEALYDTCCAFCEYATVNEEEETAYCKKKKKGVSPIGKCLSFRYDLLKRKPQARLIPKIEFPSLD